MEKNLDLIFGILSLLLLISYILLIIYEAKTGKRKVNISEEDEINISAFKSFLSTVGILGVVIGSRNFSSWGSYNS